jgi:uncharacterized membrane-anchored protein
MKAFEITREDGRSNTQVLLDLVQGCEAGRTFAYDEIAEALSAGTDHAYSVEQVRAVAAKAYDRLLREQQRALHNVRGVGYRIAPASDHRRLAVDRKDRADVQLKRGLNTLRNVRWDEMEPEARKAHEGTLMVVSAMYEQQRALDRRQSSVEDAIRKLMGGGK